MYEAALLACDEQRGAQLAPQLTCQHSTVCTLQVLNKDCSLLRLQLWDRWLYVSGAQRHGGLLLDNSCETARRCQMTGVAALESCGCVTCGVTRDVLVSERVKLAASFGPCRTLLQRKYTMMTI